MHNIRIAYILSNNSFIYKTKIFLKYFLMRRMGFIYPDVFCIPYFINNSNKIFGIGDHFYTDKFNYIFTELYAYESQLEYLNNIAKKYPHKLIVILGPPHVLNNKTSPRGYKLIKSILQNAKLVLSYSYLIKKHYLELAPESNIELFNWPFDINTIKKIVKVKNHIGNCNIDILINTPLRFNDSYGLSANELKKMLNDVMCSLGEEIASKILFHSFVYTNEDRNIFYETKFASGLPLKLHNKLNFKKFVLFVNNCDVVINFVNHFLLGRITLISAALNKPGLFGSSEMNDKLYPQSTVSLDDLENLKNVLIDLIESVYNYDSKLKKFMPNNKEIEQYGNFELSCKMFSNILTNYKFIEK